MSRSSFVLKFHHFSRVAPAALAALAWCCPSAALAQEASPTTTTEPAADTALTPGAEAEPAAPAPMVSRPGTPSQARALDLCALKPTGPAGQYQTQRVLFMNPLLAEGANAPETETNEKGEVVGQWNLLAEIKASEMARLLLAKQFPMQRLYTALSPTSPTDALLGKSALSAADLSEVGASDAFVAYSAGCADWIAAPKVTRTRATWSKVKRKKTVYDAKGNSKEVEYLAWDFEVGFKLELALFKRDGAGFRAHKRLDSGGVAGMFAGGAAAEPRTMAYHDYASTWPDGTCQIGAPEDGKAGGLASCAAVEPSLSSELTPSELDAAASCSGVDDAVGSSMQKIAGCALATSMGSAVKVLQLRAKQDVWTMFAQLQQNHTMALGAREGAKRGDYYAATPAGARGPSGFARITRLGPGGKDGAGQPSQLKFKSGDGEVGTRMTEYPLLGVHLGARPDIMFLFAKGDLETRFGYGGSLTVAYDATSYIPLFDEFWLRGDLGYLAGAKDEGFLRINAGPETTAYLGGGFAGVVGLGLSALVANRDVTVLNQTTTYSGASTGAMVRGSLEYAFSPDWNTSLTAELRSGFSSAKLKNDKVLGEINGGPLAGALAYLTVGHTL
jgi:hypothetical protein